MAELVSGKPHSPRSDMCRKVAAIKADLIAALAETLRTRGMTQVEAARLCRTDQPTLSKVLRGRLDGITIDKLTTWLAALGRSIELRVLPPAEHPCLERINPEQDGCVEAATLSDVHDPVKSADDVQRFCSLLLGSMTEGVSIATEDGIILYTNAAEDRIFGYEPGELVGQHVMILNALPPDENARTVAKVISELKARGAWRGEWLNRRKDGTAFRTAARINAVEVDGSRHWVCVHEDITERRRAEEELERSRQDLEDFFENGTVGLHWVASDGTILRANQAELDLLGYTREEYVGRHIAEFHADRASIEDILARLTRGERLDKYPARLRAKDGSIKHVLISSNVHFVDGRFVNTRCFTLDVTDRREAEAALRESEEQFRTLAESIPQLAWIANPDGWIFWYNRRWYEYTGTKPEQMRGWGWQSVHNPEVLPDVLARWKACIATGEPFEMVFPLRGADGAFRPFLTRVVPVRDEAGRIVRWFGTNTDIAEQRATAEALAEETHALEILNRVGASLAAELDLQKLVQTATDAGVELTGAQFGAFFHNVIDKAGESYTLYALSGVPREAFASFPMPRNTAVFGPTFRGEGVIRSEDITKDPRYGKNDPYCGMPDGHLPVRSYLAVPVISRSDQVHGGLFFGHARPGVFGERCERLLVGIAAQAAIAIDNARLFEAAQREIEERKQIEAALAASEQRLRATHEHAPVGIAEVDLDGHFLRVNERLCEITGYSADEMLGLTFFDVTHPDDRPAEKDNFRRQVAGEIGSYRLEKHYVRKDGSVGWIELTASMMRNAEGKPLYGIRIVADISERKEIERRQQLLLHELNHRVKNTLATIQSLARQTFQGSSSAEEARAAFDARLYALSNTHNLLTESSWEGAALGDILEKEIAPYESAPPARFSVGGPRVRLSPRAVLTLGMTFHELVTNAAKYGALSVPGGRIEITWTVMKGGNGQPRLMLVWQERNGPPVNSPKRRGFGSRLVQRGVTHDLRGRVQADFDPKGLRCTIEVPLGDDPPNSSD